MFVARLSLTQFRNHADALIAPGPGFVLLTGENGAGKTNVLEAVSLLAPGRGLRGATLTEMARREGDGSFAVAARLKAPLPPAGGAGGGPATVRLPTPLRLASKLASLTPPPASGRGTYDRRR